MILKTEQTIVVCAQWDRWTPHYVIKHYMITTMLHQNSSEESILLRRSNVQNGKGWRIVATQEMLLD